MTAGSTSLRALEDRVRIMTSYPADMVGHYEAAFAKLHPGTHLDFVYPSGHGAALGELTKPGQSGIDVYWAPSSRDFPALRDLGALKPLAVDRMALPGRIGNQPVSDPTGHYEAFEVAGYGIVFNPALLAQHGLAAPRDWSDLAKPGFTNLAALPIASKVGFSPALYDIVLQAEGWEKGWALIGETAANADLLGAGPDVFQAVVDGEKAAALTIDFFVRAAIANDEPVKLVLPARTAFLPAHIAIMSGAPHPQGARAFVDFALSSEGQTLLFHPDNGRYPVRPDAYANAPAGTANPFALTQASGFAYDAALGNARNRLIAALFDHAVVERHDRLKTLWGTIHKAEAKLARTPDAKAQALLDRARTLAGWVPVTNEQSRDKTFLDTFRTAAARNHQDAAHADEKTGPGTDWSGELDRKQDEALALARQALGQKPG